MSVIVKGMEMPEKCGSCDLFHAESPMHCTVVKGHKTVGAPYGMPRPEWCPLIETDDSTGWIPCSERLPEDEYVLISKKPTKISGSKWSVAIAIRTADPRSRKIQWRDSGFGVIQDDKVLAWMPLPKPYEPKEKTK